MSRMLRTVVVRGLLLAAALLLPAQALAHCGVPLSGTHAHRHHAGPAGSLSGHADAPVPELSAPTADAACTVSSPVFTTPRSGERILDAYTLPEPKTCGLVLATSRRGGLNVTPPAVPTAAMPPARLRI